MAKKSKTAETKVVGVAESAPEKVLVLRTCAADMTAHGGFCWPESGPVECPDWSHEPECGHGLHGCLWGEGNGQLLSWEPDAKWLVVEVLASDVVELDGKVKFPRGEVVYCGTREGATALIQRPGRAVIGGSVMAGDSGTATAGDSGTATAGYGGTATAGTRGTATAGDGGTATAGYGGTATAGDSGTATAGELGTATAGEGGIIELAWWDGKRYRRVTGYVGEGIEANVPYILDAQGKLVRKDGGK